MQFAQWLAKMAAATTQSSLRIRLASPTGPSRTREALSASRANNRQLPGEYGQKVRSTNPSRKGNNGEEIRG